MLQLLIMICLGMICYQDMRYRAVYWICFPVLAVLLFTLKSHTLQPAAALQDSLFGVCFFGLQLLLLWIYLSAKSRKPVHLTRDYLGLGDILFLLAAAFYFSPAGYVIFYIASLIMVLLYVVFRNWRREENDLEIPLAGLQALMLAGVLLASVFIPEFRLPLDRLSYGV